jgi:hypothetical protein
MAYNSSKGPQQHGDIKYESDPLDTQIDFEDDFVAIKTNGQQRFIVSGSAITSSVNIVPSITLTNDLGSTDLQWSRLHVEEVIGDLEGAVRFNAKNDEGATITRGQVVYINGVSGQTPTVALAAADDPNKMPAFGIAGATVAQNAEVQIITFGSIGSLNLATLFPGETFSEGDALYVQTGSAGTSGSLTATPPATQNNLIQNIGQVVRNGGGGDNQIKVGGSGRTNATPNLDKGCLFVGDDNNRSVADSTLFVSSSAKRVGINTLVPDAVLDLSGSDSGIIFSTKSDTKSPIFQINGAGDVTVSNTAILLGTVRHNTQVLSTDFNVELGSYYLAVSGNASHITASLPAASVLGQGATLVFKDIQGMASTKNIVIAASGSETIDGNAQVKIQADWGAMTIAGNGVNGWAIMGQK